MILSSHEKSLGVHTYIQVSEVVALSNTDLSQHSLATPQ